MGISREHFQQHSNDVERIVRIFASKGVMLDPLRAYMAWSEYSDSYAAGWLSLGNSDEDVYNDTMVGLSYLGA